MRLPPSPGRLATLAGPLLVAVVLAIPPHAARGEGEAPTDAPAVLQVPTPLAEHRPHDAADQAGARHATGSEAPAPRAAASAGPEAQRPAAIAREHGAPPLAAPTVHHPVVAAASRPAEMPVAHPLPLAPVRPISAAAAPGLIAHGPGMPTGSFLGAPALPSAPLPAGPAVAPPLDAAQVEAEVGRLRTAMASEVPGLLRPAPDMARRWIALLRPSLTGQNTPTHPQLVVVVDRNTRVQEAALVMVRPAGPWEVIGASHVSTGQAGRWDHYITPVGVFPHTDLILDYRAEGTYNENHIRGLGVKGMRVWDFGWQWAHRGWGEDTSPIQIRMEMHATDPAVLAQRIGHTASQGCIRIPEALNRFFDHRGVLDADYERAAVDDIRYRALLPKDRVPTTLAGDTLVVVDSSGAT